MKVEKQGAIQFGDVKVGQVFECGGKVFLKGYDFRGSGSTVMVDLISGYITSPMSDDSEVILYEKAKVVME